MGSMSIWHWLIVLVIIMLVFGTKKLRNIGSDLGGAVRGFKEGVKEGEKSVADESAQGACLGAQPAQLGPGKVHGNHPHPAVRAVERADLAPRLVAAQEGLLRDVLGCVPGTGQGVDERNDRAVVLPVERIEPADDRIEPVLGTGRGALHHGRAPVVEHMSVQRMKAVPGSIAETDRHDCGPTRGESGSLGEPRGRIGRAAPGVAWIDQTR